MRPIKVGDWIEWLLTSVFITKARMQWLLGTEDCGCDSRKKRINDWHAEWQFRIIMFVGGPGRATWKYRRSAFKRNLRKKVSKWITTSR